MRELVVEDETARRAVADGLLADLGREPSHAERLLVEQVSALIIRGRRLRERGMSADGEMIARLVVRSLGKLGIRAGPATPTGPTFADIKAKYARTPAAPNGDQAAEQPADETRMGEAPGGHSEAAG